MKVSYFDIADFYKQLSLLTKTGLPLPDTLRQLAPTLGKRKMRELVERLGESTAKGMSLADSMRAEPDSFQPFFIKLVELGERRGGLSLVLAELGRLSRMNYMLSSMVREIMFYPLVTASIAFFIFLMVCNFVLPGFWEIYKDLFAGEPLPTLTNIIVNVSLIVNANFGILITLYIFLLLFFLWLNCGRKTAQRFILAMTRLLPLSEVVFYNLAMARLCSMWAAMMKQNVPVEEAFPAIAEMMDVPELSADLRAAAEDCAKGMDVAVSLEQRKNISGLLVMAVRNSPESSLPDDLEQLADLFRERGSYGFRRIGMTWEFIMVTGAVLITGTIIFLLFMPILCRNF